MNHRLQLSPIFSPPAPNSRLRLGEHWSDSLASWEDAKFFRSWLVYDSALEPCRTRGRFNWNIVAGLILMAAISAGGWFCVGSLAQHFLK